MATNVDKAWTSITLGQQSELLRLAQIQGSHVNKVSLQLFIEGKDPFPKKWIEKDGYIDLGEFIAPGWNAKEWEEQLLKNGHELCDHTKDILSKPDFDKNHSYPKGTKLHVIAMRGKQIQKDYKRTTSNLKALGSNKFGEKAVSGLKAELTLMIRLKYSNQELEEMELCYIATLHKPIIGSDGCPRVLHCSRLSDCSQVGADWVLPGIYWPDSGAFAFLQDSTQELN